jgi:predicted transposase/invertase (TIGR01784 family)
MNKGKKLVRFDWAMKKLLRDKANFDVLEGFLSVLLNEQITVKQILDSESNKKTDDDKHNRVDILVQNSKNELVIIEVQNSKEYDYFHRILFGTSKVISEHIKEGEAFAAVKKVISITIAYFDLGQGKDYVYHGKNVFKGLHKGDILNLSERQIELYNKNEVHETFPEYWLIKVGQFKNRINDRLDEWIYFFKNSEVKEDFTAQGLPEAKEKLDHMKLSGKELLNYESYLNELRNKASEQHTKMADAQELIDKVEKAVKKGKEEMQIETVIKVYHKGKSVIEISELLDIPIDQVQKIITEYGKGKK